MTNSNVGESLQLDRLVMFSPTEEFVLSQGLNFCLPPTNPKREEIFAKFEVLITQLQYHRPQSREKHSTRALERGVGQCNDPGAHGLLGGSSWGRWLERAHGPQRGPIEMTLRNQHVKPEDLFFGDHLIATGRTVRISVKTFFFWRSHFGQNCGIFSICFGVHKT